jgi:hypothetical protein
VLAVAGWEAAPPAPDRRHRQRFSNPLHTASGGIQEFDDATLLSNGNIVFSRMPGAGMVTPDKQIVWEYVAPSGTEIHSCQYLGNDRC